MRILTKKPRLQRAGRGAGHSGTHLCACNPRILEAEEENQELKDSWDHSKLNSLTSNTLFKNKRAPMRERGAVNEKAAPERRS